MPRLRARVAGVTADVIDILDRSTPLAAAGDQENTRMAIASRAYQLWLERGCPEGSPEEDWYKAELELQSRVDSLADRR